MRHVVAVLKVVAVLVAGLLAALTFLPEHRGTSVHVALVIGGVAALLGLLGVLRALTPRRASSFEQAVGRRGRAHPRVAELARVEREVALATASAGDVHLRLVPRVREIAAHRLSARHAIDLETQPGAAQAALPPAVWALVRPDLEPPRDRFARGIGRDELRAVVDGLESI